MFEELIKVIKPGNVVRVTKGGLHLCLEVKDIEVFKEGDYTEIGLGLIGGNRACIFSDTDIRKVRSPHDVINDFKFCYRIVDDEDAIFYITDK